MTSLQPETMANDDAVLLERYALTRDADAFAQLARRYAGLVYGTCLRICRNPADAEDAAQDCFLDLARRAGDIRTSLAGWLHATARSRAMDVIRRSISRKNHEAQLTPLPETDTGHAEPTWDEIAPHVDQALADLPEDLREPILLHFFKGKSQSDIAEELGINQSTVSRRLEKGVFELRGRLKQLGLVASVTVLVTHLSTEMASAAPPALIDSLSRMALAGLGSGHGAGLLETTAEMARHNSALWGMDAKLFLTALIAILAIVLVAAYCSNATSSSRTAQLQLVVDNAAAAAANLPKTKEAAADEPADTAAEGHALAAILVSESAAQDVAQCMIRENDGVEPHAAGLAGQRNHLGDSTLC